MFLNNKWYCLQIKPGFIDLNDPIKWLDTELLRENILAPIFGIIDIRTDTRIDFVCGKKGIAEL